jgi:hypothetical protein
MSFAPMPTSLQLPHPIKNRCDFRQSVIEQTHNSLLSLYTKHKVLVFLPNYLLNLAGCEDIDCKTDRERHSRGAG